MPFMTHLRRLIGRLRAHLTQQRRAEVYVLIDTASTPHPSYHLMVILSATIAGFGLLANSTAVVIGAMLLAPLMGPILGMALALAIGDLPLMRKATLAESLGVLLALVVGFAVGSVPYNLGLGSEILARTQPTIYDMVIALAAGLAGAYASIDEDVSPTLPGVAIAVALIPPLASSGICFAFAEYKLAWGAMLLFLANFVGIQLAASAVFLYYGMPLVRKRTNLTTWKFVKRFGLSILALIIMSAYMTQTLVALVTERIFSERLGSLVASEVRSVSGAQVDAVRTRTTSQGRTEVIAVLLTPAEFRPQQVADLEATLRAELRPDLDLIVRSVLSRDVDRDGAVYSDDAAGTDVEADEQAQSLAQATRLLTEALQTMDGARLLELRRADSREGLAFTADVQGPTVIGPEQVTALQDVLDGAFQRKVKLVVRTVPVRAADAQRFLYEPEAEVKPAELVMLRVRLKDVLQRRVAAIEPIAVVDDLRLIEERDRLLVSVMVHAPRLISPEEVATIQADVRNYLREDLELVVRTIVMADATATQLLPAAGETLPTAAGP